jgi:hypothetical protein
MSGCNKIDLRERWAASVNDLQPALLVVYRELMAETADREWHAELLRRLVFKGTAKTSSEQDCACIGAVRAAADLARDAWKQTGSQHDPCLHDNIGRSHNAACLRPY